MPSIEENRVVWDSDGGYPWAAAGEEWSFNWGDSSTQWASTILPRLSPFLPATSVLEIAPGFGRWSQHLIELCDRYVGIDLSERAVQACRERYSAEENVTFFVNDGVSLAMVGDHSIDLAFSFDSLVHVEMDVIEGYLRELERILRGDGVGFLHHSNLGGIRERVSNRSKEFRAQSVSADTFVEAARAAGLVCISQELIAWNSAHLIDCISVVVPSGSMRARPLRRMSNPYFLLEKVSAAHVSYTYRGMDPPLAFKQHSVHLPIPDSSVREDRAAWARMGPVAVFVYGPWLSSLIGARGRDGVSRRARDDRSGPVM